MLRTKRVNVDSAGDQANNDGRPASNRAVSDDGRYVIFYSRATDLVTGDTNRETDIFAHDQVTGVTQRVSVASDGGQGDSFAQEAEISGDGRYVGFESLATNLVAGDINAFRDIFVRDLVGGTTQRVSLGADGVQADNESLNPALSRDGRHVAFASVATNLAAGDTNGSVDIFVRDLVAMVTERVSVGQGGTQGDSNSYEPSISADGRYVAFLSFAANLVAGDTDGHSDIFVRDRVAGTTQRVSLDTAGGNSNNSSSGPSISADGRYVAFQSSASDLVAGDTNTVQDIFVRDLVNDTTQRVSVATGGAQADGFSKDASISADGRYVTFASSANLVATDTNSRIDIFVHDRSTGITERVSSATGGGQANDESIAPSISGGGRHVVYGSYASNLVPGDTSNNGFWTDVFVAALGTTRQDHDGTGRADILWRNNDGTALIWSQNGAAIAGVTQLGNPGPQWQVLDVGDFNGDGTADILWRNGSDGSVVSWAMHRGQYAANGAFGAVGAEWQVAGTGDLDRDGDDDVVWRNTSDGTLLTWRMSGQQAPLVASLGPVGLNYVVEGVGDVDRDGDADLVWRDGSSGAVVLWRFEAGAYQSAVTLGTISGNWQIQEVADLDGDRDVDLLWRNVDGSVAIWRLENGQYASATNLGLVGGEWAIEQAADHTGDGTADILWRRNDGTTVLWTIENAQYQSAAVVAQVTTDWQIVG